MICKTSIKMKHSMKAKKYQYGNESKWAYTALPTKIKLSNINQIRKTKSFDSLSQNKHTN